MCESNHSAKEDNMRQARQKPDYQDTWHHCYNRTVGTRADRPFGDAEKEMFVRLLKRLAAFYSVRVVSYTFMSNHYNSHQARTKRSTVAKSRQKSARPDNRSLMN